MQRSIVRQMEPFELRDWIERSDYTVTSLAAQLGVEQSTVYRWRNGTVPIPESIDLALRQLGWGTEAKGPS